MEIEVIKYEPRDEAAHEIIAYKHPEEDFSNKAQLWLHLHKSQFSLMKAKCMHSYQVTIPWMNQTTACSVSYKNGEQDFLMVFLHTTAQSISSTHHQFKKFHLDQSIQLK